MPRGPHFSLTLAAVAALLLLCITAAQARTPPLDAPTARSRVAPEEFAARPTGTQGNFNRPGG